MNKIINIDHRRKIFLRQKYGLSNTSVSNALKFKHFSKTAKSIRQDALIMLKEDLENCEKYLKEFNEL